MKKDIADFPLHIVQAMCEEQVKQGNEFNPEVFAMDVFASKRNGEFSWYDTEQGMDYWENLIVEKNFTATH